MCSAGMAQISLSSGQLLSCLYCGRPTSPMRLGHCSSPIRVWAVRNICRKWLLRESLSCETRGAKPLDGREVRTAASRVTLIFFLKEGVKLQSELSSCRHSCESVWVERLEALA